MDYINAKITELKPTEILIIDKIMYVSENAPGVRWNKQALHNVQLQPDWGAWYTATKVRQVAILHDVCNHMIRILRDEGWSEYMNPIYEFHPLDSFGRP